MHFVSQEHEKVGMMIRNSSMSLQESLNIYAKSNNPLLPMPSLICSVNWIFRLGHEILLQQRGKPNTFLKYVCFDNKKKKLFCNFFANSKKRINAGVHGYYKGKV